MSVSPDRPYKFLDYYELQDHGIFFGRSREIEILLADIMSTRMVLLFAPTGSGKSSLINAGVRPKLEKLDYQTVYVRVEKDPARSIGRRLHDAGLLPNATGESKLTAQLLEAAVAKPLVVFLDQFEEFFIHLLRDEPEKASQFVLSVAEIHRNRDSGVSFVFSMREEFFVRMNVFREHIPTIFHNDSNLQLRWFDHEQATEVITKPPKMFGVSVADDLVARLLDDLHHPDGIEPARLQIVCDTLWREHRGDHIDLDLYESLGRAQGIVGGRFASDIAATLDDAEIELFSRMVPYLGTEYGTKTSHAFTDFMRILAVTREEFAALVEKLKELHLVRESPVSGEVYVEWTTDYLSDRERAGDWQARLQYIQGRRLLQRGLKAGEIARDDLDIISASAPLLQTLTSNEAQLLFETSLRHGSNMSLWFQRALDAGVPAWDLLERILSHSVFAEFAGNVIALLRGRDEPEAVALLERALQGTRAPEAAEALSTISRGTGPASRDAERILRDRGRPDRRDPPRSPPSRSSFASELTKGDWDSLLRAIATGRCTPLIGGEVNSGILPTPAEIAQELASYTGAYPFRDRTDLARVAEYATVASDSHVTRERVRRLLERPTTGPYGPLDHIAELPFQIYLTTNYDTLLERALEGRGRKPRSEFCLWDSSLRHASKLEDRDYQASVEEPLVFHLYGVLDSLESLVLTDNDHSDFLVNLAQDLSLLPVIVQAALARTTLLFLGHDLTEFRSRQLLLGLSRLVSAGRSRRSFLINGPSNVADIEDLRVAQSYFEQYGRSFGIRILWSDVRDFAEELSARWRSRSSEFSR